MNLIPLLLYITEIEDNECTLLLLLANSFKKSWNYTTNREIPILQKKIKLSLLEVPAEAQPGTICANIQIILGRMR